MKILVTGGAGFIGNNFIRYLLNLEPETEILNFDKLTYAGNRSNLKDFETDQRYKFFQGDICDQAAIERALELFPRPDAIVNFAAETHVDRSIVSAGSFVQTDVYGTYVLLETVRKHQIPRYLHISTDEVYGSIDRGSFTEDSNLAPNSPYAASKGGGDLLVRAYFKTYGLPVIITRSSNNYGPYQYPEKIIPLFITNALEKMKLPLYGDGQNIRDWLYVEDNCEAINLVLRQGKSGEIYNIGGGQERANIEITKLILKELGQSEDAIEWVKDRPGHDRRYAIDRRKIKALGWRPKTGFEEGLRRTISWYKENSVWWRAIKQNQPEFKRFSQEWYKK